MMPNRNYIRGRAHEYRTMDKWRKEGYIVARTAGSHGLFDVIAISPPGGVVSRDYGVIHFIQCKSGKHKEAMIKKVIADGELSKLVGTYIVTVEVE